MLRSKLFVLRITPQSAATIFQKYKAPSRGSGGGRLYIRYSTQLPHSSGHTRAAARYKFSVRHVCFICRAHAAYVKWATNTYIYLSVCTRAYELNDLNPFLVVPLNITLYRLWRMHRIYTTDMSLLYTLCRQKGKKSALKIDNFLFWIYFRFTHSDKWRII
jgi:hypothetical protein